MESKADLLEDLREAPVTRRSLLPWWIKIFVWIYMVAGIAVAALIIYALTGAEFQMALYGLEANKPLSALGLLLTALFLLKGAVAYGLWNNKDWAIMLGLFDGIIGIAVCVFVMIYVFRETGQFSFRLEILLLIAYLLFLAKIKDAWRRAV